MHPSKQIVIIALACLAAITLLPSSTSGATDIWTPVVSNIRRTITKIPTTGPPEVVERWEGKFFRIHTGSQLQKLELVRPLRDAMIGHFIDRPKGKFYDLSYPTRTALLRQSGMPRRGDKISSRRRLSTLGRQTEVFLGLPCFVVPVSAATPSVSGRGCYSPEYDLHLYWEIDMVDSNGTTRHRQEYYDLQIGRTPESDQVRLPKGFVVQESPDSP